MLMVLSLHGVCSKSINYDSAVTSKTMPFIQELRDIDASTIACGSRATGIANSSKSTVKRVIFHQTPVPTSGCPDDDLCLMQLNMHIP